MKLPEVKGKNKIRDAQICRLWAEDLMDLEDISRNHGLTIRRISQILYKNKDFVKSNQDWEKTKRKRWLKKQIKKNGGSKKDSADLVEQLRKEDEEGKSMVDQSVHNHYVIIRNAEAKVERNSPVPELPSR
jgi:hypothetical protein